jgi:hypothetical protein
LLREKQDEEDKILEAQEYSLRRSMNKREVKEKYTFEKLNADLSEKSMIPVKASAVAISEMYGVEELKGVEMSDFLDSYDSSISTDTNLDNVLAENHNLREISSLDQRHKNPKCQAHSVR